jgi:ankyrin repeat protein
MNLFQVATEGNLTALLRLIQAGAEVNATNYVGQTALHFAAQGGNKEIALALIQAGAEINATDQHGGTPLHRAAYFFHAELALMLIKKGAKVNATDYLGQTPLHKATIRGHTQTALTLIENGAEVNATDKKDKTPLHWAAQKNHDPLICTLKGKGANPNATLALALIGKGANPNATDNDDETPLHMAIQEGYINIALALIKNGTDVNTTSIFGINPLYIAMRSPLYMAIQARYTNIALAIIHYGKVPVANIPAIEENPTSQYIQRLYSQANNLRKRSYARGLFHGMNASFREAMLAGMKIHFMATGIKDGYLTIMNLLRDQSPSGKLAPSSLPDDMLRIILEYTGHWSSDLKINLQDLMIGHTSAKTLKSETPYELILTHKDSRFPNAGRHYAAAASY